MLKLPTVTVSEELMDPTHVLLVAGKVEQSLVSAYVAGHGGEYPPGNVKERGEKWADAAVSLRMRLDRGD